MLEYILKHLYFRLEWEKIYIKKEKEKEKESFLKFYFGGKGYYWNKKQ